MVRLASHIPSFRWSSCYRYRTFYIMLCSLQTARGSTPCYVPHRQHVVLRHVMFLTDRTWFYAMLCSSQTGRGSTSCYVVVLTGQGVMSMLCFYIVSSSYEKVLCYVVVLTDMVLCCGSPLLVQGHGFMLFSGSTCCVVVLHGSMLSYGSPGTGMAICYVHL